MLTNIRIARKNESGFTIVELLIAMTVFAGMMLIATLILLQVSNMYYRGVNTAKTQEVTRTALAAITEQFQFNKGLYTTGSDNTTIAGFTLKSFCIGDVRFSYAEDRRVSPSVSGGYSGPNQQIKHVLWQDRKSVDNCPPVDLSKDVPSNGGRELLDENMRLAKLTVTPVPSLVTPTRLYSIDMKVIYGDNDLIERDASNSPVGCLGSVVGSQWCATSGLQTQVFRLIN